MSQSQRQSELFAGNDWLAAYRAFTEVNLNSSDFTTIRAAMVDYVRQNYAEDFNDWIESSEFVAIIELLAYLGQNLAFRTDLNARENFLETARRRESVLRLARSLSYNARRNYPARGLAKLTEIRGTQDILDSTGKNLNNQTIRWDDPNNPDWFEQWVLVINSSLITTNPFGVPLKTESLDGVDTQLYRFNNVPTSAGNFPFTSSVGSQSLSFDVVNPDFNATYGLVEQTPDPNGSSHIIYRSDGNGNSSPSTGFFVYIKQGVLQKSDFLISDPQENRSIYLDALNINETDVWVQSVDDQGAVLSNGNWTRVGHVPSDDFVKVFLTTENVTYNGIDPDIQNIYQVVTQEQDGVALRFGDGRFGRNPTGNLRAWYRVSSPTQVTVRPEDIQGTSIDIPFYGRDNTQKKITLTFSLQSSLSNGVASETNADVRQRASLVYGTQGRMVSGSDYNELPTQTNLAVKLKAINRIYSGQSRFIDLNDPTGNYQNTNVFSSDGAFYALFRDGAIEVSHDSAGTDEMMSEYLANAASGAAIRDFYANWLLGQLPSDHIFSGTYNHFTNDYLGNLLVAKSVRENLDLGRTFALGFNNDPSVGWYVMDSDDINPQLEAPYAFLSSSNPGPNSWLIHCQYDTDFWRITTRGLNYVFESVTDCRFYFVSDFKSIDPQTGKAGSDTINILRIPNGLKNISLLDENNQANGLQGDLVLKLEAPFTYEDGFQEPRRVKVRFSDSLSDGVPDVPWTFQALKNIDPTRRIVVHLHTTDTSGYPVEVLVPRLNIGSSQLAPGDYGFVERVVGQSHVFDVYKGSSTHLIPSGSDLVATGLHLGTQTLTDGTVLSARTGVDGLSFLWKHFAPSSHRIDPSVSNIMDMFVLTKDYNDAMVSWRDVGADPKLIPTAPSELTLRTTFSGLEDYKMFSDEMIWRPVKFKLLFGPGADPSLRAKFKVVPLLGTTMSDGEIKSQVISVMRDFFEVSNWDFGETFYFSELGAYIHRRLSSSISSVEIVPVLDGSYFGSLREISSQPDELFFSTAQVGDIDIISANTPANLRIK